MLYKTTIKQRCIDFYSLIQIHTHQNFVEVPWPFEFHHKMVCKISLGHFPCYQTNRTSILTRYLPTCIVWYLNFSHILQRMCGGHERSENHLSKKSPKWRRVKPFCHRDKSEKYRPKIFEKVFMTFFLLLTSEKPILYNIIWGCEFFSYSARHRSPKNPFKWKTSEDKRTSLVWYGNV